jgi:hypothetical protein
MMEEENGIDELYPSGLRLPSLWIPAKLFVPAQDTRKATLSYSMLGGQAS